MLFGNFWRRNLGFFRLAILTNLEYRVNFLADVVFQPLLGTAVEITLWIAIFSSSGTTEIGGFGKEFYLSYVLWGAFVARITANWMYEFRMIEEVENGSINGVLVRPISFYEYYLSQFLGYKVITTAVSLLFPIAACLIFKLPVHWARLPLTVCLVLYYLVFVHTISFWVATLAFKLNRVGSLTIAKNLAFWLLSGELFPIDLLPEFWKNFYLALPFSNAVYVPVAFLTGRVDISYMGLGFLTTTLGLIVFGFISYVSWHRGLRTYTGTGA